MSKKENENTNKNVLIALTVLTYITSAVAGYEFISACKNFRPEGNIFDFCASAVTEYIPYTMIFLLVLFTALPFALYLFKDNGLSVNKILIDKEHIVGDIFIGIGLGGISSIISLPFTFMRTSGCSYEHTLENDSSIWLYIMLILSLTFCCGLLKELFFRGFALNIMSDFFGENTSIAITAILFGIVDWQNMGSSVVFGLLWGFVYKKKRRLIIPVIAHGLVNLIGTVWMILFQ